MTNESSTICLSYRSRHLFRFRNGVLLMYYYSSFSLCVYVFTVYYGSVALYLQCCFYFVPLSHCCSYGLAFTSLLHLVKRLVPSQKVHPVLGLISGTFLWTHNVFVPPVSSSRVAPFSLSSSFVFLSVTVYYIPDFPVPFLTSKTRLTFLFVVGLLLRHLTAFDYKYVLVRWSIHLLSNIFSFSPLVLWLTLWCRP